MKKLVSAVLLVALALSVSCLPALAYDGQERDEVIYLDDGYYMIVSVNEEQPLTRASVKSGSKVGNLYNGRDELVAVFTLRGTFTYNGRIAEATSASCSYSIKVSGWKCTASDAYYKGDTAYGEATFEKFLLPDAIAYLTLTCSPSGVLS